MRRLLVSLLLVCWIPPAAACPPKDASSASKPQPEPRSEAPAAAWDPGGQFSHLISVESNNYDSDCNPWLTADETELFFIRYSGQYGPADDEYQGSWDIYHAYWDPVTQTWGPASNLGPNVNTDQAERRPTTTATGDTLFFSRSGSIYVSIRTDGEFGPATFVFQGSDPCLSSDGQHLYYVRSKDIWVADRGPSQAVDDWINHRPVGPPVNTTDYAEVRPYISRDDSLLFFSDFGGPRPGGYGGGDLWVSRWTGSGWGEPENVGPPINVDRPACTPFYTADGKRLLTASESFEGSRGCEDVWIAYLDSLPQPELVSPPAGTWTKLGELPGAWNVYDLAEDADGVLYAATSPGARVFRSTDDGLSWETTAALPGAEIAYSLLVASDGSLYVGTYPNGDVFRSTDRGQTWQPTANLPAATAVRALLETHDGRILAGTSPICRIYATTDAGATWVPLGPTQGMENSVTVLFEDSHHVLYAGGWGPHPNLSTDGGTTWQPFFSFHSIGSVESFMEDSDGVLWMTGWGHDEGGFVAYSTGPGSWTWCSPIQVDSVLAVRVYDIVETPQGDLLAGFQPGPARVCVRTSDGGTTWVTEGSLGGAHEILRFLRRSDGTILAATTPNGDIFRWTPGASESPESPRSPELVGVAGLCGVSPNPSPGRVSIRYQLPRAMACELEVLDARGRRIRRLAQGYVDGGIHRIAWDGTDAAGRRVANGFYFVRLRAGGTTSYEKFLLLD
jgi:photosystem II stability/assembly factor-like uncharacterized protein